jgi:hypothetical protein
VGFGMVRGVTGCPFGVGRQVGSVRVRPPIMSAGVDKPRRVAPPQLGHAMGSSRSQTLRRASKAEPQAGHEYSYVGNGSSGASFEVVLGDSLQRRAAAGSPGSRPPQRHLKTFGLAPRSSSNVPSDSLVAVRSTFSVISEPRTRPE